MPWVGIFILLSLRSLKLKLNTIVMREDITYKWNWNNATDFANWMTAQVTHKVLSEFWLWYNDVGKAVSRMTDNEHE